MEIVMRHEARQVPSWLIFDVRQSMSRVSLIRIATYGIFVVLAVTAHKERYFVSFFSSLPDKVHPFLFLDAEDQRHGGYSPSIRPGFADTRLSGRRIMEIARDVAKVRGIDLQAYGNPDILLHDARGRLKWSVTWFVRGKTLRIWIDDESATGESEPEKNA